MQNVSYLRTLVVAGVLSAIAAGAAFAGNDLQQQRRAMQDTAYWQGRSDMHQPASQRMQGSNSPEAKYQSDVSQYPCHRCVYDHARGGYVFSPSKKN